MRTDRQARYCVRLYDPLQDDTSQTETGFVLNTDNISAQQQANCDSIRRKLNAMRQICLKIYNLQTVN